MAGGARFDYVLQKGHSNIRWHNIASIELGWGTHRQPTHQSDCGQSPGCTCMEADCDGTDAYNGSAGSRIAKKWEILVSAEADILFYGHTSASLVIGRSL